MSRLEDNGYAAGSGSRNDGFAEGFLSDFTGATCSPVNASKYAVEFVNPAQQVISLRISHWRYSVFIKRHEINTLSVLIPVLWNSAQPLSFSEEAIYFYPGFLAATRSPAIEDVEK